MDRMIGVSNDQIHADLFLTGSRSATAFDMVARAASRLSTSSLSMGTS